MRAMTKNKSERRLMKRRISSFTGLAMECPQTAFGTAGHGTGKLQLG